MDKITLFVLLSLIFTACNEEPKNNPQGENKTESPGGIASSNDLNAKQEATFRDFQKTVSCGGIQFEVKAENGVTSTINVTCDDLAIRKYDQEFNVNGHLKYAFVTDQNEDGFCELYLVVEKNDGSGNLDMIGIASFNNKSAGEITISDVSVTRQKNTDKVYVNYEKLRREFLDETGNLHIYNYNLVKGEAGYILEAVRYK